LDKGRIARTTDADHKALETNESRTALMDYLNPADRGVEDIEVIQAAKLIHWADNAPCIGGSRSRGRWRNCATGCRTRRAVTAWRAGSMRSV